jgi:hypothetical protein
VKFDRIFVVFSGELVAHFKFTVLLMPNGPHKITGLPFEPELYQSEHTISDPELKVCNVLVDCMQDFVCIVSKAQRC